MNPPEEIYGDAREPALNPRAASHAIVELKGVESAVQMHVGQPVIYLRVGDDSGVSRGGGVFTVDRHTFGSGLPACGFEVTNDLLETDADRAGWADRLSRALLAAIDEGVAA